jgi:segregation and condensation protein B
VSPEHEPTDPTATEPAVSDPTVPEPAVSDPTVPDLAVSDPTVPEPAVSDPTATEPVETADPAPSTPDSPGPVDGPAPKEDPGAYRNRRGATESAGPVPVADLRSAVEAILLVVDTPVAEMTLAQVLERPTDDVRAVLRELAEEYTAQARGMDLRQAAGGWRLYTRSEYAPYVERFVLDGQQARLTQAALETLSVVAYRQPVTRSRISAIRGVGVDGVIRTLVTRGLIEEAGAEHETGAHLYRTTTLFLEKLGLNSLDELPPLAPLLPEIEALDDVIGSP